MVNRTAKLVLLLLGIIMILGAAGCSGSGDPIVPGSNDVLASTDTTDEITSDDESREVAQCYSGAITDSNGDPLAWAELYLDDELAGWTEEDGSFTIYNVYPDDEYTLEARIDGEVLYTTTVCPAERSGQGLGDPDPEIERGTVWGYVHDQIGPVPHALVIVFNSSENFGVDFTDQNGFYEIVDAPGGPGMVLAFAPEHATAKEPVMVIPGGEVQKNLFLPKKLDAGLVGGWVLTGPVGHVQPVPFAKVTMEPIGVDDSEPVVTFTNKHGLYKFPMPVPIGPHHLAATAPGFNVQNRIIEVHPGRNLVNFHIEPVNVGGVKGQVTDVDGEPIPHALVRLVHPNPDDPDGEPFVRWEFTSIHGFYMFKWVIPGQYGLDCHKPGYLPWHSEDPVPVFVDQYTIVDITLEIE